MNDTKHEHPWDVMVDSGYGWTDQLVTQWDGKAVYVTRNIDSPEERVEHIRVVFPDGSRLYLGLDASPPILRTRCPECGEQPAGARECTHAHPFQQPETDAERAWGEWVKHLYDNASIQEVDTDL